MQDPAEIARRIIEEQGRTKFREGSKVALLKSGTQYTIHNLHTGPHGPQATIRRAVPKVKGKAARRADKVARRSRGFL